MDVKILTNNYDLREEIVAFSCEDYLGRHAIYQAIGIAERRSQNKGRLGLHAACEIYEKYRSKIWLPKGEADSCPLFQEVCRLLWASEHLEKCTHGKQLKGDTMNSTSTTLNELFKASKMGEAAQLLCGTKEPAWSKPLTVWLYSQAELSHYRDIIQSCNGAEDFLRVSYTIGNLAPVPVGCNRPRGTGQTKDYWDLALYCIYNWYLPTCDKHIEKDGYIEKIVGQARMADYRDWLKAFGDWDTFVEKNFMQPFVEGGKPPFGKPKELWAGHFAAFERGEALPQGEKGEKERQISEFFTNAAKTIRARSELMIEALKLKTEDMASS